MELVAEEPIFSPEKGRKRKNVDAWETNVAKKKRNLGEEYVSSITKKVVPPKGLGPPVSVDASLSLAKSTARRQTSNIGKWWVQYTSRWPTSSDVLSRVA